MSKRFWKNMKSIKVFFFILLVFLLLGSCATRRKVSTTHKIAPPKDNSQPVIKSPQKIQIEALSYWNSGLVHQKQYFNTKNKDYARIAIEKYDKYYSLQPEGTHAGSSLIRMAELAYYIGDKKRATHELDRIKKRYDLKNKYIKEIQLLEELINQ